MKKSKLYLSILSGLLLLASCDEDDNLTTNVQEQVGSGAVLRTISLEGGALDVLNLGATTTIMVEEQDNQDGDLLESVDVFVSFIDNTPDDVQSPAEALLTTIPASDFTDGPFGLPRGGFSGTLGEFTSALGLMPGQFNCGDAINLRLSLNLTDGRVFSADSTTGNISGGAFFSSPFLYNVNIVANLPSDTLYTGMYQLTTEAPGIFGVADYLDGVYNVISTNNTTRVIQGVTTFPAFGGFGPVDLEFQFICGQIIVTPAQSVGAGCNAAIQSGPAIMNSVYDLENPDDVDFVINFTSDETDDCGGGSVQAAFRLTRI